MSFLIKNDIIKVGDNMTLKAGVILINKNKIGLIYRNYYNDYSFPKGHLEDNESLVECAIRETEEETKRKVKLVFDEEIYIESYVTPRGEECECHYYLGLDDGHSDNDSTDTHDLMWIDFDKVEDTLSYESLKKLWNIIKPKVSEYIKND